MKLNYSVAAAILLGLTVVGLSACEKAGPLERAGKAVDNAAKKTGEAVQDAGDKVKDSVNK